MTGAIPDPFDYQMKAPVVERKHVVREEAPIDSETLSKLEGMTKPQLIALVRQIGAARWAELAVLSQEELKAPLRLKLAHMAFISKDNKIVLSAINQLLDRIEGKPITPVNVTQTIGIVDIVAAMGKPKIIGITIEGESKTV